MTDKTAKRLREFSAAHGVPRRTAANMMAAKTREVRAANPNAATTRPPSDLTALLAELRVTGTFTVATGRVPAVGRSADLAAAVEQASRLANNPTWYAETGGITMTVTREQHALLIANDAADEAKIQMIRSFATEGHTTFSTRCRKCQRWIWCGEAVRSGTCFCGAEYRVAFDLASVHHWTLPHNARCMDCGVERIMHPVEAGISPWHLVNDGQSRCNPCHNKANPPRPFIGFEVGMDGSPGPRQFSGQCPKCNAPMSGEIPAFKSSIEFHCGNCGGKFTATRRDPLREQLLKEALGPTTCHGCGCDVGLQHVADGQPIPTTHMVDGFTMCANCAEKYDPMFAASRNIT